MYTVVGCSSCRALWVVDGRPETTECPRCGKRHRFERLRALHEADTADAAREARAALLADRQDAGEAFADLDRSERAVESAGVSEEEYLAGSGIDPERVAEAETRTGRGSEGGGSREAVVRAAVRDGDAPTEAAVVAYATERGVDADDARETLERLRRAGEVTESDGAYRLL